MYWAINKVAHEKFSSSFFNKTWQNMLATVRKEIIIIVEDYCNAFFIYKD